MSYTLDGYDELSPYEFDYIRIDGFKNDKKNNPFEMTKNFLRNKARYNMSTYVKSLIEYASKLNYLTSDQIKMIEDEVDKIYNSSRDDKDNPGNEH